MHCGARSSRKSNGELCWSKATRSSRPPATQDAHHARSLEGLGPVMRVQSKGTWTLSKSSVTSLTMEQALIPVSKSHSKRAAICRNQTKIEINAWTQVVTTVTLVAHARKVHEYLSWFCWCRVPSRSSGGHYWCARGSRASPAACGKRKSGCWGHVAATHHRHNQITLQEEKLFSFITSKIIPTERLIRYNCITNEYRTRNKYFGIIFGM